MNRIAGITSVGFGAVMMGIVAYGCAFNPFIVPDYSERPGAEELNGASGGASTGGGSGGSAGEGGAGGSGGGPCMCADDGNECTAADQKECPNGDPGACTHSVTFGATCSNGGCNKQGECVSCLMCESPECMARCEKMACTDDVQCAKGFCEQNTCCNEECVGPCKACDRGGTEGECRRMPLSLQVPGCDGTMGCNAAGACVVLSKGPLGHGCVDSTVCVSGSCFAGTCRSSVGEPCVDHIECVTNLCDPTSKKCRNCEGADAGQCPGTAKCLTGINTCQVFAGQPASSAQYCVAGVVSRYVCAVPPGTKCNSHAECQSRNCVDGTCSNMCTTNAECVANLGCDTDWNMCKLPLGELCHENGLCASGKCGGFPRRCQP